MQGFWNNVNIISYLGSAFQAYDEGSIPFTRSNKINKLEPFPKILKIFLAQFPADFGNKGAFLRNSRIL